ncbi:hypothetical protein EPUS_00462 [Endocarpon pusillum Z07020]|uniref:Protein transport protein sec1 n=1 Tax=Endocarpon pusillum (strain Z07020 / HMAS-L-300199) TaxID=1263415 RepID=U1GH71_ENDPU|nr:uncharacterized protein EPUS_00462 [Endocarpon pusillum Z07020]ERF71473.1 hypothetical protein EPUS_00462 [Endocarpon pusillum Z07020]
MDAVYVLTPQPHIVDCLLADMEKRRYRRLFLVWTSELDHNLRKRIECLPTAREQIADYKTLYVDYYPREAQLVTFRDPSSFFVLFHPDCSNLVRGHLEALAQKVVSICVSLGEYPAVRYYRPRAPTHEAGVLCSHLARFIQEALDSHARLHPDFPPPTSTPKPRAILLITDRTMDLLSPLVHEFTYQAMALDLLDIKDGDKLTYLNTVNQGRPNEETKEVEIGEADKIWTANRHMHMKDLLGKIVDDFKKFREAHPQFAENDGASTSVNTIKDMLAGLPKFSEKKEAFSLHLDMAEKCMKIFQENKLLDLGSVEQSLATGLDEDYKKPKNLADQIVRLMDDESVPQEARLRLLILYILYRGGLLNGDIQKLHAHAQLQPQDRDIIDNLDLLGARVRKPLKDMSSRPDPIFPTKPPAGPLEEEVSLSRYEPALRSMLEEQIQGTLDPLIFPPTKPHLEGNGIGIDMAAQQTSLRTANKPTWARTRPVANEQRQRLLVFMAGGATYAEARACYQVSQNASKDVFLITSHMLTPKLFLHQLRGLNLDKRRLDIPAERPPPKAPAHLFERQQAPGLPQQQKPKQAWQPHPNTMPPTAAMHNMSLNSKPENGARPIGSFSPSLPSSPATGQAGKLKKNKDEGEKKKKKHHFFK